MRKDVASFASAGLAASKARRILDRTCSFTVRAAAGFIPSGSRSLAACPTKRPEFQTMGRSLGVPAHSPTSLCRSKLQKLRRTSRRSGRSRGCRPAWTYRKPFTLFQVGGDHGSGARGRGSKPGRMDLPVFCDCDRQPQRRPQPGFRSLEPARSFSANHPGQAGARPRFSADNPPFVPGGALFPPKTQPAPPTRDFPALLDRWPLTSATQSDQPL